MGLGLLFGLRVSAICQKQNEPAKNPMNPATASPPVDDDVPMSLSLFAKKTGLSDSTIWRYRQKGWLKVNNIAGRMFISRSDLAEFNRRMKAGEFAANPTGCAKKSREKKAGKTFAPV